MKLKKVGELEESKKLEIGRTLEQKVHGDCLTDRDNGSIGQEAMATRSSKIVSELCSAASLNIQFLGRILGAGDKSWIYRRTPPLRYVVQMEQREGEYSPCVTLEDP